MHRTHRLLVPLVLALACFICIAQPAAASSTYASSLTTTVRHGGNIRATPSLRGTIRALVEVHEVVTLIEKTAQGDWYHVVAPAAEGWVSVTLLTMPRTLASQVPVQGTTASAPAAPSGNTVTVFNGGNMRNNHGPTGVVIDQINAGEMVQVLARCNHNVWIKIINVRGKSGWVHKSLLNISEETIYSLPIE